MNRFMYKLHRWLSIPFGVVILVMCLTGAVLAFERELSRGNQAPPGRPAVEQKMEQSQPQAEERPRQGVSSQHEGRPRQSASHHKGRPQRSPFFMTMFKLHRWLMIDSPREVSFSWGRTVTGATTIALILILVSGLWLWMPIVRRRGLFGSLRIERHRGSYQLWRTLHITLGVVSVAFLLTMAVTGLYWTFSLGPVLHLDKGLILGLHTGRIGGLPLRLLFMASALVGIFLVISGYWLWLKKKYRKVGIV